MKLSDRQRILKIIKTGQELLRHISDANISQEMIRTNTTVQWTITTPLYDIGEHTNHISKELQAKRPEIPWRQISGMRHKAIRRSDEQNETDKH